MKEGFKYVMVVECGRIFVMTDGTSVMPWWHVGNLGCTQDVSSTATANTLHLLLLLHTIYIYMYVYMYLQILSHFQSLMGHWAIYCGVLQHAMVVRAIFQTVSILRVAITTAHIFHMQE